MRLDKGTFEIYSHTLIIYTPLIDSIRPPPDAVFLRKGGVEDVACSNPPQAQGFACETLFLLYGKVRPMQGKLFLTK